MKVRPISKIYIHCSYSSWGDLNEISSWHKVRNFREVQMSNGETTHCGYHTIIYNPYTKYDFLKNKKIDSNTDGQIVQARPDGEIGAGVRNDNTFSLHVCYVGFTPTPMQLMSLTSVCLDWIKLYNIKIDSVLGHYEYYENAGLPVIKTCPQIQMDGFRSMLRHYVT